MSEWIKVRPRPGKLDELRKEEGVHVRILVSPYDVPEAVRGYFDKKKERFIVEFKYSADEPHETESYDDFFSVRVGKHSRRLYALEIDFDGLKAEAVSLEIAVKQQVSRALDSLLTLNAETPPWANYELAKDAVLDSDDHLYTELELA